MFIRRLPRFRISCASIDLSEALDLLSRYGEKAGSTQEGPIFSWQ